MNNTKKSPKTEIEPMRDMGYDPYVMIYDKPNAPPKIKYLLVQ